MWEDNQEEANISCYERANDMGDDENNKMQSTIGMSSAEERR